MVGAPEDCICAPGADAPAFGTELAPAASRTAGLAEATCAVDRDDLPVRLVGRVQDAGTGVLGWPSVLQLTATIREEVCDLVAAGGGAARHLLECPSPVTTPARTQPLPARGP